MAKIKNLGSLAVTPLRKFALEIAEAGLKAIDTKSAIRKNVRFEDDILTIKHKKFSLKNTERVFVIGVGKCSLEAAGVLEEILGDRLNGGIAVDVHKGSLKKIKAFQGNHPLPTPENVDVTKKIISLLEGLNENDLAVFVISGGGSTLLCQPKEHTCLEEAKITDCLLKSGADIHKINIIRKHLSLARGGFLAQYAYPARIISLIFSDTPGVNMEFVASGPTMMDSTTVADAENILKEYGVLKKCGLEKLKLIETPKDKKYFKNSDNLILISNKVALEAMAGAAKESGFIVGDTLAAFSREARDFGEQVIKELKNHPPKSVLLYGGESTVKVRGKGKGGRNQELALSALRFVKEGQVLVAVASDGRDNGTVAGAICDIIGKEKAKNLGLDIEKYLKNNDSYAFFSGTGDYLITGDTGSNVSDLIIAIKD